MKKINSLLLLEQLQADVREIILKTDQLKHLSHSHLKQSPGKDKWSVIEIIDHLNFYSRYYIKAIEKKLDHSEGRLIKNFRPGWLGNYFTNIMKPKEGNIIANKMSAPKNAIPSSVINVTETLNEFISHQHHLINLLQIAKSVDLNSIRVPISLSKWITIKLGDSFRFLIAHEQRHFVQISFVIICLEENQVPA
jgi:hypothetical protein